MMYSFLIIVVILFAILIKKANSRLNNNKERIDYLIEIKTKQLQALERECEECQEILDYVKNRRKHWESES